MTIELNAKAKPKPLDMANKDTFMEAPFVKSFLKSGQFSNIEKMAFIGYVRKEWKKRGPTRRSLLMMSTNVDEAFIWAETEPNSEYWSKIYHKMEGW